MYVLSRSLSLAVVTAVLAFACTHPAVGQTTWYVDDDAPNDPGPGDPNISDPDEDGSPGHPFDAIQEGIGAAVDGDTVLVLDGTYTGTGNKDLDFHGKAITVRSENGPVNCTIDCEGDGRGFYFHRGEGPDSIVEALTLTNGSADYGGAIYCNNSSPTLTNCTISGNEATGDYGGGGVYCYDSSSPTLTNCTISDNEATGFYAPGGGVCCDWNSSPTLTNCTISRNSARQHGPGGGVYCDWSSSPTLTNCTISRNSACYQTGGVYCRYSSPTLTNCTISENTALHGGGICCTSSNPTLTNCTISGNEATSDFGGYGGGVWCYESSPTLTNCTISENTAADGGGGVRCYYSSPTLTNCILWADTPNEIYDDPNSTTSASYSDIQGGWPGEGNMDSEPLFLDPDNGDYHLSAQSPCIDAGCNGAVPRDTADLDEDGDTTEITPLDLDGEGRFFDDPDTPDTGCGFSAIVDMGAYEFGGSGPQPCPGDMDGDRDVDQSDLGILLASWGDTDTCDLDCDGDIDEGDLGIVLANWGNVCP